MAAPGFHPAHVTAAFPERRTWTLVVNAPCKWMSANDRTHWRTKMTQARRWRQAAYEQALIAGRGRMANRLPKQLARVRIDAVLHFRDVRRRDAGNYFPTVKAIVDAIGPAFVRPRAGTSAPGYGLIADDTPEYLDGPHITIGQPWPPSRGLPGVEVTITDLS